MAIEVRKIEIKSVSDASGLDEWIESGEVTADQIVAAIGKTEGNGGVNDFTRILSDQAFRAVLMKHGSRSETDIKEIPMVWSGGCDGVITPHAVAFARNDKTGPSDQDRIVMGTAMSAELFPEDIGRPAMVEKVADAVRAAMADAGSLTHAGDTLHLSQSAVSRQIRALEESLNTTLFHRHARGLILTEQGELLHDATAAMNKRLDTAAARIRDSEEEVFGELRVTTTTGFGTIWLAPRLPHGGARGCARM